MEFPGNQSNLLNGLLQPVASSSSSVQGNQLNGIVTSNMQGGISSPSTVGLTALQVSGTNGIILISQPINTTPSVPSTLTFALPVSNSNAAKLEIPDQKEENMNKLKALLTNSPGFKLPTPTTDGFFKVPDHPTSITLTQNPLQNFSLNVEQQSFTNTSNQTTVSSLGSSDVFLCRTSNNNEVHPSNEIYVKDPQGEKGNQHVGRNLTVQLNNVDSTTNDQLLFQPATQTFSNFDHSLAKDEAGQDKSTVLHNLLSRTAVDQTGNLESPRSGCSPLSPDITADSHSAISSPSNVIPVQLFESNTQSTLISKSEQLHLESDIGTDDVKVENFTWDLPDHEPNKSLKTHRNSNAGTSMLETEEAESLFDAGSAVSTSDFTFTKFGADVPALFTFGKEKSKDESCASTSSLGLMSSLRPDFDTEEMNVPEINHIQLSPKMNANHVTRSHTQRHRIREPSLNQQFPCRVPGYEIQILDQPEEQHRARYLTEGSRGAVKNRAGDGHALVKLEGKVESAVLMVFVGNDSGRVKPHGFYQACKVCGKNSTQCRERDIEGTTVIEMDMLESADQTVSIDNVGILKLRNADVEQRIGLAKAKKKSTKARLIFRVIFQKQDGNSQTLQIASNSILCTQPIGQPEICKISCKESPVDGGGELFIIGKNFMKGTKVYLQERKDDDEDGAITWQKEADIDKDYFQQTHLVCTIPPYHDQDLVKSKKVQLVVHSAGKASDPAQFTYTPVPQPVKHETPMETDNFQRRTVPFTVSPEALKLNNQIQQTQQAADNGSGMFQLPPGTLNMDVKMQVDTPQNNMEAKKHMIIQQPVTMTTMIQQQTSIGNMEHQSNVANMEHQSNMGNLKQQSGLGNLNSEINIRNMENQLGMGTMMQQISMENQVQQGNLENQQEHLNNMMQQQGGLGSMQQQSSLGNMSQQGSLGNIPQQCSLGNITQQGSLGNIPQQMPQQGSLGNMLQGQPNPTTHQGFSLGMNSMIDTSLTSQNTNMTDLTSQNIATNQNGGDLGGQHSIVCSDAGDLHVQHNNSVRDSITTPGPQTEPEFCRPSSNQYSTLSQNMMDVSRDLAEILQDAKTDHPENNIDKMAEAILNEKWQEQTEVREQNQNSGNIDPNSQFQQQLQASSSIAQLLNQLTTLQSNRISTNTLNFQQPLQSNQASFQSVNNFNQSPQQNLTQNQAMGITGLNPGNQTTLLQNMNVPIVPLESPMTSESTNKLQGGMDTKQNLTNSQTVNNSPNTQNMRGQTPQIIICNPPPVSQAPATNFVPSPAAPANPPSIVILGGQGGNQSAQGNNQFQVENILRSILDTLRQQGNTS